jgi:hypothetical protein
MDIKDFIIDDVSKLPYPTIGGALIAVFSWSGLWEYVEKKKVLQRKYERLANEDKLRSHDEIEKLICETLALVIPDDMASYLTSRLWVLLMDGYRQDMRDNATWFDREETCRWFVRSRTVVPLVVAIQRLRNLCCPELMPGLKLKVPSAKFWFLPERTGSGWEYPGQRVIAWWLEECDIDPKDIESRTPASNVTAQAIKNWRNKGAIPLVSTLKVLEGADLRLAGDEAAAKRNLTLLMMASGVIKGFFSALIKCLGDDEVEGFIADFKVLYNSFLDTEKGGFDLLMDKELLVAQEQVLKKNIPSHDRHGYIQGWLLRFEHEYYELSPEDHPYKGSFADRMLSAAQEVESNRGLTGFSGEDFVAQATRQIWVSGQIVGDRLEAEEQESLRLAVDAGELAKGLNLPLLPRGVELARIEVDVFRERCHQLQGFDYYADYIEARMLMQEKAVRKALESYRKAFLAGRYRAGGLMEAIVMEYLSVASYLYTRKVSGVRKDEIRYMQQWLALIYPKHRWAKMPLEKCISASAENLSLK